MTVQSDERVLDKKTPPSERTPLSHEKRTFQVPLIPPRIITHHPKAGLNPLVDAAATLFSIIGRLKSLQNYRRLSKLQQELIQEIQQFQNAAKAQGYNSEHILVSRYALCAVLDDLIQNSSWGSQGQWTTYSLLTVFHPDTIHPDRFFSILERLTKEPSLYIDILELMYLCLTLGFKGPYRYNPSHPNSFDYVHFETMTQRLYQQIRTCRGDFPKNLSPYYFMKPPMPRKTPRSSSLSFSLCVISGFLLLTLSGLGYSLGTMIAQINQDLQKPGIYETNP